MVVAMEFCFEKFQGKLAGFTPSQSRKLSENCHTTVTPVNIDLCWVQAGSSPFGSFQKTEEAG